MNIAKASLQMPCTSPITIAGILSFHGRKTSPFLQGHRPPLFAMSRTSIRSRIHGELSQIIHNQASLPKCDKKGKINTGFKPEKLIIGVVVGLCVIGAMSRRHDAQIMSPRLNIACMSQSFDKAKGTKPEELIAALKKFDRLLLPEDLIAAQKKLDRLLQMAIYKSKEKSPKSEGGNPSEDESKLEEIDKFIEEEKYEEAWNELKNLESISLMNDSIPLRQFIALIGQAKQHLEDYILATIRINQTDLLFEIIRNKYKDLGTAKTKNSISKFLDKMTDADSKWEEYKDKEDLQKQPRC